MKSYLICILLITSVCSAQEKLELPLLKGQFAPKGSDRSNTDSSILVLYPDDDHQVRAAEGSLVQAILNADSNYMIALQGKYRIKYMNLYKVNVKTGDIVKKGQIIGETLFVKDAPDAGRLLIRTERKGKYITNTTIF